MQILAQKPDLVSDQGRDPYFAFLTILVLGHFLYLSRYLVYPDLILNYPFMGGDSHDWLANGLFFAGLDVRYSARPPLLPLILAGLHLLSALSLFPILLQAIVHGTILGLYKLLCLDTARPTACLIAAAWMLNATWMRLSFSVMADVLAACLLFWSYFYWRRGREPGYVLAGFFAGLSAIAQQIALLVPIPVFLTVFCFRRRDLVSSRFVLGSFLFALPTCGWLWFKSTTTGTIGDVLNRHWSLLTFHTDSIGEYFYSSVAFVGLPAMGLILLGAWSFSRRVRRERLDEAALLLGIVTIVLVFFVLIYEYSSYRFLVYVFPLSAVLLAEGLRRLRRPRARWIAIILVLAWSMVPSLGPPGHLTHIAIWPAPLTYLAADLEPTSLGSKRADLSKLELEVRPMRTYLGRSPYHLLKQQRRIPLASRDLSPETFEGDRWAVFFYDEPEQAGKHYGVITRLGNLLLKRVQYLPFSAFESSWPDLSVERLGVLGGTAIYRAGMPGDEGTWLIAVSADGRADRRLREPFAPAPTAAADLKRAKQIAASLGGSSTVMFAPDRGLERWLSYLPFLVDSAELLVVEEAREPGIRKLLGPGHERARFEGVAFVEHRVFGRPWVLLETIPDDGRAPAEANDGPDESSSR